MMLASQTNTSLESHILQLNESGGRIIVDLRWPAPLGCINEILLTDFEKLCDYFEDNSSSTIVIFRGFTGEVYQEVPRPSIEHCSRWEKILCRLARLPAITIAAIDGNCMRFCLQLALACDYRLATENSLFVSPEIKEGYLPGMIIFQLAKFVGIGIARRILFSGLLFNAREAQSFGLLDGLCTSGQLTHALNNLVDQITPINSTAVQLGRRLLNESFADTYEKAIGHFLAAQYNCLNQNNRS